MNKIVFFCPWESTTNLLNKLKKNTLNNKGVWKNIIGIDDIKIADYIIILDDLPNNILNLGYNNFINSIKDINKLIYFQRENTALLKNKNSWFRSIILSTLKHNYSYDNGYFYTFTTAHFLNKSYDELKSMKYPDKNKNISCIVSSKNLGPTYTDRKKFIKNYSNNFQNSIDIYGKGWDKELGNNYKGELGSYHQNINKNTSKLDGLLSYNYSICLENYPQEKVMSEKITDCLLSWCLPIYSGSEYTNKYYPKDSFYLINIKDETVYDKIYKITNKSITKDNINAIRKARNLILDKYNIWEQIFQIIDNVDVFKKNYKFI